MIDPELRAALVRHLIGTGCPMVQISKLKSNGRDLREDSI
jgi:hypothetical protein